MVNQGSNLLSISICQRCSFQCTDAYLRALFVRLAQTARARVARLPVLIADLPASE